MHKFKVWMTFALLAFLVSGLQAGAKRYHIKSGIVTYKIEGGGSILGISNKTSGQSKLYFKDWGNLELRESSESQTTMGRTDKHHRIQKIDHGTVYSIDDKRKIIIKQDINTLKKMGKEGKDMSKMGKDLLKEMGGKKIGTGKVLGYPCEIWELMGSKSWIYKGVPLKTEANIMGFKHLEIATKAEFGKHISDKVFQLPKYPVKNLDQIIQEGMKDMPNNEKEMPRQKAPNPEQMKQIQEMMKNLGGLFNKQ